ncbi:MAG TPA: hypothetical protein VF349_05355, partial [Candidatus Limnocylindrales bacterium]
MPATDPLRSSADSPRRALAELARSGPAGSDQITTERFEKLLEIVDGLGSCVLALSGGIDSSFLL